MTELIIDFDMNTEEEGPYEALYNAASCHSLDSMASGRSSDRDSVNREAEAAGVKAAGVRPVRSRAPTPGLYCQPAPLWGAGRGCVSSSGSCFSQACVLLPQCCPGGSTLIRLALCG